MNILVVHNFYQQPGGEDQVFNDEVALLRQRGHQVGTHTVHNDDVQGLGKLSLARKTLWNRESYDTIRSRVERERIDVVHFHNTFPLVSPAAYYAARDGGAAVVQTLHNYRLLCPAATFFRDGGVCEDCLSKTIKWPAVAHKCYRENRAASAVAASLVSYHHFRGTWQNAVDAYIALTEFARRKFVEGGLPADKIAIKPNFVSPDPGVGSGKGGYAVFIGRLSPEKGLSTLLQAWELLNGAVRLKILGDGPLREEVQRAAATIPGVEWLGRKPSSEVYAILSDARALIFPSQWYEGLPRTIVESFAKGTPVIATDLGSMTELVQAGINGQLFQRGDASDLARQVGQLFSNSDNLVTLRAGARETYLRAYTAEQNYPMLIKVYERARRVRGATSSNAAAGGTASAASGMAPPEPAPTGVVDASR